MRFEGQIVEAEPGKILVDAEPHVMQRIRKIFDNASNNWERGRYTHKPIRFASTLTACRDLLWLLDRYHLEVSPDLLSTIQDKAKEYDRVLRAVSDADKDTTYRVSEHALPLALSLRDHQIQFTNMFSQMRRMLLADRMGLGKAQPLSSAVMTPTGPVKMGTLKVNDLVIGLNGKPIKVMGIYPQGMKRVFKVNFTDGYSALSTEDHLWQVSTARQRHCGGSSYRILPLSQIAETLSKPKKNSNTKYFIPTIQPIEFNNINVPIDPYLLGLLIGDGGLSTSSIIFTTGDEQLLDAVKNIVSPKYTLTQKSKYDYRITLTACVGGKNSNLGKGKHNLKNSLHELGLMGLKSNHKFIPKSYLYNNLENRIALLQGLMDTDGYINKDGTAIQFSSSSEKLVDDFVFLIQSLGGIARKKYKKTQIKTDHWIVTFNLSNHISIFRLDRKNQRRINRNKYPPVRGIESIEFYGEEECQCIRVEAENGLYLTDHCIATHNTPSAISVLCEPERRPALVVVPTHLCTQWEREVKRFLPGASTHVIRGFKNYPLPRVDVLITSYNRLAPWQDILLGEHKFKTLIMDEVHELRHTGTGKRRLCFQLSETVDYSLGLSGTPIYNQGNEIYSVLDVIKPGCLGSLDEFESEWCNWGKVYEPATLNHFLKNQGLMLRRNASECGLKFGEASKHIYTIDSDLEKLKEIENIAKLLALSVLSGNIGEDSESAREFDWKLRHATGVAKARPVAEFVKMLVEEERKVVLVAWHRDCYEIYLKELKHLNPVMYTGSETTKEKDDAVKAFIEGDSKVFIISLRSGSGLDGLQKVCNTIVFGELDWSPHVMDQVVARLDRDGQTEHVNAYYLTIADGADPFMIQVLNGKRSQHDGLIEGKQSEVEVVKVSDSNRVRDMAKAYLTSIGEEIPESVPEVGLLGEVINLVRTLKLPTNTEEEMQEALYSALKVSFPNTEREFKVTKRSRLDFMIGNENEKVAIECKIDSTQKAEVYRQVRRYAEEGGITSLVLVAPWMGIREFKVDNVPVLVVDTNVNAI